MKIYFLPSLLFVLFTSTHLTAQITEEKDLTPAHFKATHPSILRWEQYFHDTYFSKGIPPDSLGEGTGYLPFWRDQYLYNLRKDYMGETHNNHRWHIFQKMQETALERGGALPAADWKSLGPDKMEELGGRMISHAFEPGNSQVIWAGSASGGLWLTENGGELWQPMTDQIPSTGIGAVAVNPQNPASVLIGTGEGYTLGAITIRPGLGVFKSVNKGMIWDITDFDYTQSAGVSVFKIVWNYADTNIVWMAATNGLWKSTDGGLQWALKKGDGTNQNSSIFDDLIQHPTNPDILYAAWENNGVWKSIDGGETWVKKSEGIPSTDINFIKIDICKAYPDVLFASVSSDQATGFQLKGLYKTNNSGESWTKIEGAPNAFCPVNAPAGATCQGWYDNVVAVSPVDTNFLWLGGATLWRTDNGGSSWTQHDYNICLNCPFPLACMTYVDQHDFAFDPENPNIVYAFNDGGISKSYDGGLCFEQVNKGLVTAQFYAIASGRSDPGTVIAGTQDHGLQGINLAENTELAWDRWGFLDGSDVEVHGTNSSILYGGWITGHYWRSNGGVHILANQITSGINLAENNGFYFAKLKKHPTNQNVLLGATAQKLYRTASGGVFWTPVATIKEPKVFEFDEADPTKAYVAAWSNDGTKSFWRSEDAGLTWTQVTNNPGWRTTDMKSSPAQPGLIYISRNSNIANSSHVMKSTNSGSTWTSIQGNLPNISVNCIAVHHFVPGVVFVGTDLGVFITTDDGLTWNAYNQGMPVTFVMDIEFNPSDTSLRIGTLGRGAWVTKAWMPDISSSIKEIRVEASPIQSVSPNPLTIQTAINWQIHQAGLVKIQIVNANGQLVKLIYQAQTAPGAYVNYWDGRTENGFQTQAGVYFIQLFHNHTFTTKKLIKSR